MKYTKILFGTLLLAIFCMGCTSNNRVKHNTSVQTTSDGLHEIKELGSSVAEVYEGIEYNAIVISEDECCIQSAFFREASQEQCKKITIPEQIQNYKVVEISGTIDENDETVRNIFGDVREIDADGWICKESGKRSENIVEEIIIPNTVEKLTKDCFSGLTTLKRITLPKSLKIFDGNVFCDDKSLMEIDIPQNVSKGLEYITGKKWKSFRVDPKNSEYQVVDGMLQSGDGKILYGLVTDKNHITISEGIVVLADNSLSEDEVCEIRVDKNNPYYGKDGQCIYKKKNGELISVFSQNGELVLSNKIKVLETPVMVSGPEIKKIIYSSHKNEDFAIRTVKKNMQNTNSKWSGSKISSSCTWDVRGRKVPVQFSPEDFSMGKIIVTEDEKKLYQKWLDKYEKWNVFVDLVVK